MSDLAAFADRNDGNANHTATGAVSIEESVVDGSDVVVPLQIQQELPFLVTHWLANYGGSGDKNQTVTALTTPSPPTMTTSSRTTTTRENAAAALSDAERQEALSRIRRATSEIASAFATLGAYGTTIRVSCLL